MNHSNESFLSSIEFPDMIIIAKYYVKKGRNSYFNEAVSLVSERRVVDAILDTANVSYSEMNEAIEEKLPYLTDCIKKDLRLNEFVYTDNEIGNYCNISGYIKINLTTSNSDELISILSKDERFKWVHDFHLDYLLLSVYDIEDTHICYIDKFGMRQSRCLVTFINTTNFHDIMKSLIDEINTNPRLYGVCYNKMLSIKKSSVVCSEKIQLMIGRSFVKDYTYNLVLI